MRRALAIQLILNREFGVPAQREPAAGRLPDRRAHRPASRPPCSRSSSGISERGGVLGAMETMYQRGKIQDESLRYETDKHSGELPIVGVNTFLDPGRDAEAASPASGPAELIRASAGEKQAQLASLRAFQARHAADAAPAALARLQPGRAARAATSSRSCSRRSRSPAWDRSPRRSSRSAGAIVAVHSGM